jgi:hypothetical protein
MIRLASPGCRQQKSGKQGGILGASGLIPEFRAAFL